MLKTHGMHFCPETTLMQKPKKDKCVVKPDKQTCEKCENHELCLAEVGHMNYKCPKMLSK